MSLTEETFSLSNHTKGRLPRLPFVDIKNAVVGTRYELSILFATTKESQTLNHLYRNKNKPTNVLSFPYTKKSGEIVIHLPTARTQAPKFGMKMQEFVAYLFIHGLLHLKGMEHGGTMEAKEKKFLKQFGYNAPN